MRIIRSTRLIVTVVAVCYLGLGVVFMQSSTLNAWPSSSHWGAWTAGSGGVALLSAWRPTSFSVSLSGTLLVAVMFARAFVLAGSLLFDPDFTGGRADAAWAGMLVAVALAWLVFILWSRIVAPAQAWSRR